MVDGKQELEELLATKISTLAPSVSFLSWFFSQQFTRNTLLDENAGSCL